MSVEVKGRSREQPEKYCAIKTGSELSARGRVGDERFAGPRAVKRAGPSKKV